MSHLFELYKNIRQRTSAIAVMLTPEDSTAQPIPDVSPPKWHLAHTTWFFETFLLYEHSKHYRIYDPVYNFLFNSYYEGIGDRVPRSQRGNITRPGLAEILAYREFVDDAMLHLISSENNDKIDPLIRLGLQHEQQHQELLITDIKYILSTNPVLPAYDINFRFEENILHAQENKWIEIPEGLYDIGHKGPGFCFDNELGRHTVFLHRFQTQVYPVSNKEYLEFIEDGGYGNYKYWLADGWDWVKINKAAAPLYWKLDEKGKWLVFTLKGKQGLNPDEPVCHINFYEADAFARWKGARLLTEFEWEAASPQIVHGSRWEWTNSAYLPYPFYKKEEGAIGEYNGKFMINQMVLRGGSAASPPGHVRSTYRNFFAPDKQWQYTGIRIAKYL